MELKEKVAKALRGAFKPERILLRDQEGISGFVVSPRFRRMRALDRQQLIYDALRAPAAKLTQAELRQVLAIAPLTPTEYAALGEMGEENGK